MLAKINRAKEIAEIDFLRTEVERLQSCLSAIFAGIAANEHVPLRLEDGTTVLITKAKPRRGKD